MKSHGSESIATYKTHDVTGALGLVTIIGLGSGLATRFSDGWQFLSLTVLAGCALALVLYWRQGSGISEYRIPATGGVIGLIAIAGIGVIMMRFHALRYFFGLVLVSGGAIALLLRWLYRRGRSGSPDPAPCFAGRFLTYNANCIRPAIVAFYSDILRRGRAGWPVCSVSSSCLIWSTTSARRPA